MTLLLAFPALHAQDQIITIHSDTLHCRITETKSGEIKYSFQNADSSQVYNASIPIDQVKEIRNSIHNRQGVVSYMHTSDPLLTHDQIITINSDTLTCTITEKNRDKINYSFQNADSTIVYNASMPTDQVKEIRSATYMQGNMALLHPKPSTFWLRFEGGYSRRLGKIPEELSNTLDPYMEQVRNGFCMGGSLTYFPGNNFGLGVKYNLHRSRASLLMPNAIQIKDDIFIHFIAPALTLRFISPESYNAAYLTAAFGVIRYRNSASIPDKIIIKAKTVGFSLDFGYDIGISDDVAVTLGCGIATGYYESFELTGSAKKFAGNGSFKTNHGDNLLRLNLTVGLAFK